jgi:hypothetical protein
VYEGTVGNEKADQLARKDLNIRSQNLNQLVTSQLELPRKRSGTGGTEITKDTGNPQLDSNRQTDLYQGSQPEE